MSRRYRSAARLASRVFGSRACGPLRIIDDCPEGALYRLGFLSGISRFPEIGVRSKVLAFGKAQGLEIGTTAPAKLTDKERDRTMYSIFLRRAALAVSPLVILSACVSQSDYDAVKAQNQQLQQQVASLDEQVNRLQNAIRYTVNSDLLFPSGSWQLSDAGKSLMARIASQLAPFQTRRIVVNGYTDNQPIGAQLRKQGVESNEVLSQRRAQAVLEFLKTRGVKPEFMEAKGWGESNPLAPNNTPAGRAENRRVEITFATTS